MSTAQPDDQPDDQPADSADMSEFEFTSEPVGFTEPVLTSGPPATPLPQRTPGSYTPPRPPDSTPIDAPPKTAGTERVILVGGPRCGHYAWVPRHALTVAVMPSPLSVPGAKALTPGDPGIGQSYAIYRRAHKPDPSRGFSSANPRFVLEYALVRGID